MTSSIDLAAARRLLGQSEGAQTNDRMFGLKGQDRCPHVLCGNGEPIDELSPYDAGVRKMWASGPYRHHEPNRPTNALRPDYCICGNPFEHRIHEACAR